VYAAECHFTAVERKTTTTKNIHSPSRKDSEEKTGNARDNNLPIRESGGVL
jgi:hypothetical protein